MIVFMVWIMVFYVKGAAQDWELSQRCLAANDDNDTMIISWSVCIVVPIIATRLNRMVEPATILLTRALLNQLTMQCF